MESVLYLLKVNGDHDYPARYLLNDIIPFSSSHKATVSCVCLQKTTE